MSKSCLAYLVLPACLLFLPVLLGWSSAQAFVEIDTIGNINFGTWTDAGTFASDRTLCIASANTSFFLPWGSARQLDYNVRIRSQDVAGELFLYKDGNTASSGNRRIAVNFTHRDLLGSGGQETLLANQYDSRDNEGQFRYCLFGGQNAGLRIELPASELNGVASGDYIGNFRLQAENNRASDSVDFTVSVTVQSGPEVRISGLNDLDFGSYGGADNGGLLTSERFCVYSSNSNYRLSVSSANQDFAGNFYLHSVGTGDSIPMSVRFSDSGAGTGTEPVGNGPVSGIGNSNTDDCGGSNNATLTFALNEADLNASSSGGYSDSLILLVEPE